MPLQATPSTDAPSRRRHLLSDAARYRWAVASRALAAIGGGYVLSSLCSAALAIFLPLTRPEAVITGTLAALAIYPCAVMWVFAARTAWHAWIGLALPAVLLGSALWLAMPPGGAA